MKKEEQSSKMKNSKIKKEPKPVSKAALLDELVSSKIGKPLKQKIVQFMPEDSNNSFLSEKSEILYGEESKVKKSKAQKSFDLLSSLVDEKSSEE